MRPEQELAERNNQEAKVEALAKRLDELSQAVCHFNMNEFTMRVPADPKRDADIVLLDAATELVSQRTRIEELESKLESVVIARNNQIDMHQARIAELESRLSSCELDAARYRWLRDGHAYAPEEEMVRGGPSLDVLCDEGIAERVVETGRAVCVHGNGPTCSACAVESQPPFTGPRSSR